MQNTYLKLFKKQPPRGLRREWEVCRVATWGGGIMEPEHHNDDFIVQQAWSTLTKPLLGEIMPVLSALLAPKCQMQEICDSLKRWADPGVNLPCGKELP